MKTDCPSEVELRDAEAQLPNLLDCVESGHAILLSRAGEPAAMLLPISKRLRRHNLEGKVWIHPETDWPSGQVEEISYGSVGDLEISN